MQRVLRFGLWVRSRGGETQKVRESLSRIRIFSFDPKAIAQDDVLYPNVELQPSGQYLAVVLDRLRDQHPERFESLNRELNRWLPEFNRILFDTPNQGSRRLVLRTCEGAYKIKAKDLSQGTLIALAVLTLAYLADPPSVVCLEEPDHGLHPRLLRDVRDAIYRLAYPESAGEKRDPVQVVATTHNPYFLDLFREHPEEIVIAEKVGLEAKFSRLSDRSDLNEILGDAHLGDVWYSGVLGGVPAGT
jgi:predicted ATPase